MNLFIGGRYISKSGFLERVIDDIRGDDVHWSDKHGGGMCSKVRFKKWAGAMSPDSPEPPLITLIPQRISKTIIASLLNELEPMRTLRQMICDAKVETEDPNSIYKALIHAELWRLRHDLESLEQEMAALADKNSRASRIRTVTNIDKESASLDNAISALMRTLTEVKIVGDGPYLLHALSGYAEHLRSVRAAVNPL